MIGIEKKYVLQYRWKPVEANDKYFILYYGIRNYPKNKEQLIEISSDLFIAINAGNISAGSAKLNSDDVKTIGKFIDDGILVEEASLLKSKTKETMQVCKKCVNNDYIVPGLQFDESGICALCQCYSHAEVSSSAVFPAVTEKELLRIAAENKGSRFDAMVFYTGGKDSTYMLWLLARKLKLRVLAGFWNMPYCSGAAYENIKKARRKLPEVEFVEWSLPLNYVHDAMRNKWKIDGLPCLCPTAAFPLLYPLAVRYRIPYVFLGLEDVQASVVDYVFQVIKNEKQKPLSPREQTLLLLKARSFPRPQKTSLVWTDEMANYHAAVNQSMPGLFNELLQFVQNAQNDPGIHVPVITRLSTTQQYGSWNNVRELIEHEMDWRGPEGQNSLLHTSCDIEPVKDYLQFLRFTQMKSVQMPQSIIETSAAVYFGMISREEGLRAVEELGFWNPPDIFYKMIKDLDIKPGEGFIGVE